MAKKKASREKLVDAAYQCFSQKGYLGTTTKEIARVAGVSEMTLFRIFGTKENILESVLKTYSILPELKKTTIELKESNLEELLKNFAKKSYQILKNRKEFIKITLSEINMYPEKIRKIYEDFFQEIENLLIDIIKQYGHCINDFTNLKIAVTALRGMIFCYFQENEIILNKNLNEREINSVLHAFVDIFLNGITK